MGKRPEIRRSFSRARSIAGTPHTGRFPEIEREHLAVDEARFAMVLANEDAITRGEFDHARRRCGPRRGVSRRGNGGLTALRVADPNGPASHRDDFDGRSGRQAGFAQ